MLSCVPATSSATRTRTRPCTRHAALRWCPTEHFAAGRQAAGTRVAKSGRPRFARLHSLSGLCRVYVRSCPPASCKSCIVPRVRKGGGCLARRARGVSGVWQKGDEGAWCSVVLATRPELAPSLFAISLTLCSALRRA
eukprot:180079-Chlamydomonas_euryale.AAC.2